MYKIALLALVALFFPIAAFAAPSLSLDTVDTKIDSSDTVLVTGMVTGVKDFKPVNLQVIAPDGEIVYSYQITLKDDGTIKRLIHPPLPSFKEGTYTVILSHPDATETAQIEFTVTSVPLARKDIPISALEPEVEEPEAQVPDFEHPLIIRAEAMEGDTVIDIVGRTISRDQSVSITVESPRGNLVTVAQVMPGPDGEFKTSIKTGGPLWKEDGDYTVTAYQGQSSELESSVTVGIKGGAVIPEFGTIAVLVLSVSIISIIVLTRTRASIFPRI